MDRFFPNFETCPRCDGHTYTLLRSEIPNALPRLQECSYCHQGKIAVYNPKRHWLSKLLCCCSKYDEPIFSLDK